MGGIGVVCVSFVNGVIAILDHLNEKVGSFRYYRVGLLCSAVIKNRKVFSETI